MAKFNESTKLSWVPEMDETIQAEQKFFNVEDTRKLVEDTTGYPFKSIAFITSVMGYDEDGDEKECAGTGFLCENNLFLTVAHNVRYGKKGREKAGKVTINFGFNGAKDNIEERQIVLDGSDFTVPTDYKKQTDEFDIAWINIEKYYNECIDKQISLSWDLTDVPRECFFTCSIPQEDGKLDRDFSICGYPEAERNEIGYPGFPPATQWTNENILVQRLSRGQHLLYREATGQGMSGSPLYFMDEQQKKAYVVGVHVGGSKILANSAVPISYHITTIESWNSVSPEKEDSPLVNLLSKLGFGNLASTFIYHNFTVEMVMSVERSDLNDMGLKVGQVKEFLVSLHEYKLQQEREKEEERKRCLKGLLEKMKKIDLLDTFMDKKVQVSEFINLSEEDLSKMGISIWKRRGWSSSMEKLKSEREDLLKQSGEYKDTQLMDAVQGNNIAKVQQIIKDASFYGVLKQMVNIPDKDGRSPLRSASFYGYTNIVSMLLDAGAEINQPTNDGATPLYVASQNNHLPVIKELVSRGADINKVDNDKVSPAYKAAQCGNVDVLRFLIAKGVDVRQKSYENQTLLHIAALTNHHSIVKLLLKDPKIKKLIDDSSNTHNDTPLTFAIRCDGDLAMVKLLVNHGANKDKGGNLNKTPLQWAREKNKSDIIKYLQKF